jgi:hypothetical protein
MKTNRDRQIHYTLASTPHAFVGVLLQQNTLAKMKFSIVSIYLYTE